MNIRKSNMILLGIFTAGLTTIPPANAGFSQGNSVTLGGQPVFQMADAEGFTGSHRAWLAQDALDNALVSARDRSPSAVRVSRENGAVVLTFDGKRFATVDTGSANSVGSSTDALAESWAQSVRTFLSDRERTDSYVATLKNDNRIQAKLSLVERSFYAPAGFKFPVTLASDISGASCAVGQPVEGKIDKEVMLGQYRIPAGATVLGEIYLVRADAQNSYGIRFHTLRTLSGATMPIDAVCLSEALVPSRSPHRVCTYVMPSGMANGHPYIAGRLPSGIGIGAQDSEFPDLLVFNSTEPLSVGRPMMLEMRTVSRVAVVQSHTM